uniref:Mitochondrial splicing suppressor 51-like C-terminal domain-containing protein n=1 Tax=Eptatretus burgeri TaxID=7764 RepID=A0A8C4N2Y9_EPTBU
MDLHSGCPDLPIQLAQALYDWSAKLALDQEASMLPVACGYKARQRAKNKNENQDHCEKVVFICMELPLELTTWLLVTVTPLPLAFYCAVNLKSRAMNKSSLSFYGENFLSLADAPNHIGLVSCKHLSKESLKSEHLTAIPLLFAVLETNGRLLGATVARGGPVAPRMILDLLRKCMFEPLGGGKPYKPREISMNSKAMTSNMQPWLKKLGVRVKLEALPHHLTLQPVLPGFCFACASPADHHKLHSCPQCGAILICSNCYAKHNKIPGSYSVDQTHPCTQLAEHMAQTPELNNLPFTFMPEVMKESFLAPTFLVSRGLTEGLWRLESVHFNIPNLHLSRNPSSLSVQYGLLMEKMSRTPMERVMGILLNEAQILATRPNAAPQHALGSWKEYYKWRRLDLNSPIAALLTYPLTIYYIITHLHKHGTKSIRLHIVGAEKELDYAIVFWELKALLPQISFELLFLGPRLASSLHKTEFVVYPKESRVIVEPVFEEKMEKPREKSQHIGIKVCSTMYHHFHGFQPDLLIMFHPSLHTFPMWASTLRKLQMWNIPAFITESTKHALLLAAETMRAATGGGMHPATLNPFRSPLRANAPAFLLPWSLCST